MNKIDAHWCFKFFFVACSIIIIIMIRKFIYNAFYHLWSPYINKELKNTLLSLNLYFQNIIDECIILKLVIYESENISIPVLILGITDYFLWYNNFHKQNIFIFIFPIQWDNAAQLNLMNTFPKSSQVIVNCNNSF